MWLEHLLSGVQVINALALFHFNIHGFMVYEKVRFLSIRRGTFLYIVL